MKNLMESLAILNNYQNKDYLKVLKKFLKNGIEAYINIHVFNEILVINTLLQPAIIVSNEE